MTGGDKAVLTCRCRLLHELRAGENLKRKAEATVECKHRELKMLWHSAKNATHGSGQDCNVSPRLHGTLGREEGLGSDNRYF